MTHTYWSDIKSIQERTLSEYELVLNAVESAVTERYGEKNSEESLSILRWETLIVSLKTAGKRFREVTRLSKTRLQDIRKDTRTAGFILEEDAEFCQRCEAVQFRTAHLSQKIRARMERVAKEIRNCEIRDTASFSFKPALPTQVDLHI